MDEYEDLATEHADPLDKVVAEYSQLKGYLDSKRQIQYSTWLNASFNKTLVIAAFSALENELKQMLEGLSQEKISGAGLRRLFQHKILARGLFTLFDFKSPKAQGVNSFLGHVSIESSSLDSEAQQGAKSFITLGCLRNELTHKNFLEYPESALTVKDVLSLYKEARAFINFVQKQLESQA